MHFYQYEEGPACYAQKMVYSKVLCPISFYRSMMSVYDMAVDVEPSRLKL